MTKRVWVYHNKVWNKAEVVGTAPAGKVRVRKDGDATKTIDIAKKHTMAIKHNGRRATKTNSEVLPNKTSGERPSRYRPLEITIEQVAFTRPRAPGDYYWQLQPEQYREYGRTLHIYNENMDHQTDKMSCGAGGGNACARPFRQYGKSIGMPTGWHGGFRSLEESCVGTGYNCTAKEGIDMAAEEIVMQVYDNPDRYDRLMYCVNNNPGDTLIGMGIFNIEHETRSYITERIVSLPGAIRRRNYERRRAVRN